MEAGIEDPLEETDVALDREEWTRQKHEMQRNGLGFEKTIR
jgi:hypothetical protein